MRQRHDVRPSTLARRDLRREFAQDIEFEGRTRRELPVGVRGSERADRSAVEFGNEKASLTRKSLNLYRDLVEAVIGYRDAGHTPSQTGRASWRERGCTDV